MIELRTVSGETESLALMLEKGSIMEMRAKKFVGCWWNNNTRTWMLSLHFYKQFQERFSRFDIQFSEKALILFNKFNSWKKDLLDLKGRSSLPNYKQHCKFRLEPYQPVAAAWLVLSKRGILADPVGTGKTYSCLEAFCLLNKLTGKNRAIILSLNCNIYQWKEEIDKAFPQITPFVVDGDRDERERIYREFQEFNGLKALIINYEILIWDLKKIQIIGKDVVIADEASKLKSKKVVIKAKIIDGKKFLPINGLTIKGSFLKLRCEYMWGASATPIETGLGDLYSIFNCVKNEMFRCGWGRFAEYFLELDYFGKVEGEKNIEELIEIVSPFIINRPIDLGLDIEAKDIFLEFGEKQLTAYNAIKKAINSEIKNNPDVSKTAALDKLTKLRQLCNFPDIVIPNYVGESVKIKWTINKLKEIPRGEKTIIFSQWTETTDRISKALNKEGIKHVCITGEFSTKQRDKFLKKVQFEDLNVIIATDCISYGRNIQYCNWMIMFDLLWNPAKITQRAGRIARKGQLKKVHLFMLIVKNSVEEKVLNKIRGRINLFKKVLGLEWKVNLDQSELVKLLEEG